MKRKSLDVQYRNELIIQARYVEKKTLKDIALMFNISRQAVLKIIKAHGVEK